MAENVLLFSSKKHTHLGEQLQLESSPDWPYGSPLSSSIIHLSSAQTKYVYETEKPPILYLSSLGGGTDLCNLEYVLFIAFGLLQF